MNTIIKLSLILNILILIPVCLGILFHAGWVFYGWGIEQPSLSILVSIYFTILLGSVYLLIKPNVPIIFALLLFQVVYKFFSIVFVGTLQNPVVLSNIVIAIMHSITISIMYCSMNHSSKIIGVTKIDNKS